MLENDKTNSDKDVKPDKNKEESQRGLWIIIGIGAAMLLTVVAVGSFFVDSQKIRFVTEFSLTVALATLVAVQAYIYKRQWEAMQDSVGRTDKVIENMRQQLAAIGEQINVGRQQTDWMRIQAEAMTSQIEIMNNQTSAMILSLEETRKIVDQNERTIKATEKSIEIAEKTSIYAQRAYVAAKIRDIGERDETLQFRLRIENSGNTPANNVYVAYACRLADKPPWNVYSERVGILDEQIVFETAFDWVERLGVIAPNGSYHVVSTPEVAFDGMDFWSEERKRFIRGIERFEAGEIRLYCWGSIDYEDIFNAKRHTAFCFYQSQERPDGYPCEHGNKAT